MRPVNILMRLNDAQANLNLRFAHMPEITFSYVVAHILVLVTFVLFKKDFLFYCDLSRIKHGVGGQGGVVQSTVSLTSSLVVKVLTILVSTISNSQEFLLKKM